MEDWAIQLFTAVINVHIRQQNSVTFRDTFKLFILVKQSYLTESETKEQQDDTTETPDNISQYLEVVMEDKTDTLENKIKLEDDNIDQENQLLEDYPNVTNEQLLLIKQMENFNSFFCD